MHQSDPFHRNYAPLTNEQKADIDTTKVLYEAVWDQIERLQRQYPSPRDFAIAITHLQESCMWAVRGITRSERQL